MWDSNPIAMVENNFTAIYFPTWDTHWRDVSATMDKIIIDLRKNDLAMIAEFITLENTSNVRSKSTGECSHHRNT